MKSKSKNLPIETVKKMIAQMLLDSTKPLSDAISKAVVLTVSDFIIDFRKKFLSNMEFITPVNASKLSGIPLNTIYTWISSGNLYSYTIDSTMYISMTQLYSIPYKARSKVSNAADSTPVPD